MGAHCLFMDAQRQDAAAPEWFAVQVWSGREHVSAMRLRSREYEVFLPCYRERRRWSDRTKVVDRALFAGYVFCRMTTDVIGRVITAPGVIRIVGDSHSPSPVPAHEIESIQRIVETRLSAEPWLYPDVGQKARIELGPLHGVEGTVLMVKNRHRLIVSVALLQRAVAVEIDPEWITLPPAYSSFRQFRWSGDRSLTQENNVIFKGGTNESGRSR
jgi:transcription antitermination factor NusG